MYRISTIGSWTALTAFIATVSYVVVQVLQVRGIIVFPADEILIYGTSLCIVIPFVLTMLALHYTTQPQRKFWTHAALISAVIYAIFVTANYVVQLATVVPLKMRGSPGGVLEQTPHSLFWDFDALGYIFMGLCCLAASAAFEKRGFEKWVRISLLANGCVTPLIAIVYFYPVYSEKLLMLGFAWGITAPLFMLMLCLHFKRLHHFSAGN
jgi:hypothetical protein